MRQQSSSLHYVIMVKFNSGWVLVELERALDVAEVIVLKLKDARYHVRHVLLIVLRRSCFVRCSRITLLGNDSR